MHAAHPASTVSTSVVPSHFVFPGFMYLPAGHLVTHDAHLVLLVVVHFCEMYSLAAALHVAVHAVHTRSCVLRHGPVS